MDSNRASQEQDQDPVQEEPEGFPGLLSAEDSDNSSQIEVGDEADNPPIQHRDGPCCVTSSGALGELSGKVTSMM